MQKKIYTLESGSTPIIVEFNDLASQADGSVMVRRGNTVVLATAVMSNSDKSGANFFPLVVDYEEKFYATGQILGSRFTRREGRPSDEAILSGRIVDRTIRPLFDQHIRREVQVIITILSIDEYDPDVLGVIAASLALGTSRIPWNGPVSAVRISKQKNADVVINPHFTEQEHADTEFDMIACGKDGMINMIEIGSKEVPNAVAVEALQHALEELEKIQAFQQTIIKELGKQKEIITKPELSAELVALFEEKIVPKISEHAVPGEGKRSTSEILLEEWLKLCESLPEHDGSFAEQYFEEKIDAFIHDEAIDAKKRADGRGFDDIRPLFAQAGGISPILHGSGIFYRGDTHVFSALTLGGPQDAQIIDGTELRNAKRFMHHYNFPPFSTGETGRVGSANRRMIGHGALAEKALYAVIPSKEKFPYTIRLVSETMSSNGSSSMASVCASSLALMDGGVPISAPVAGIASGLMMRSPTEYVLLTDIQGPEDHYGDMDFKVAGTRKGITAVQMDVKVSGVPVAILTQAFEKAEKARQTILDTIEKELARPRQDISPHAPKIIAIKINPDQIGMVIGPGGKMIKGIKEKTGAEIEIEDDGTVFITGKDGAAEKAQEIIADMTREYKKGEKFEGEVIKITDFGAFVRIGPNAEGLVHVSEIAPFRIENVGTVLKIGQRVPVVIKEIDEKKRINLSIKLANPDFIKKL